MTKEQQIAHIDAVLKTSSPNTTKRGFYINFEPLSAVINHFASLGVDLDFIRSAHGGTLIANYKMLL